MSKKKFYLEMLLKDEIVEGQPDHSVFSRRSKTALQDVLEALQLAARDRQIAALSLTIQGLSCGWARLSSLRRALWEFRESGRPIYCFLQEGGNAEYHLASACDRIFMPPSAHLNLVGLAAEVFFFRDLMDRFGLNAQLQSVGEYKSAAEMFTRSGMSGPAREQLEMLLEDCFRELCRAVGQRGFSPQESEAKVHSGPFTAREALAQGLIDGICYPDEVADKLKEKSGKKLHATNASRRRDGWLRRLLTFRRPRIAVIEVAGHIDLGESRRAQTGRRVAGSDTVGSFLEHARKSRRIRAVVLRIDSPGGSGLASDLIWRKVSQLAQSKPVVASFGDVAASGGYYIATPASRILAEVTTITGSIGVLAGKFVAEELLARFSVRREAIQRGAHAGYESLFSALSGEEMDRLNIQLQEFYREDFLKKVATGRGMSEEEADQLGRGRVWSGRMAEERHLVDALGGILEAIREASRAAGIPESRKVRVVRYYRRRRFWERFIPEVHSPFAEAASEAAFELESLAGQKVLLLLPYSIRIR